MYTEQQGDRSHRSMIPSPFPPSRSRPGHGHVKLSLLAPSTPSYSDLLYTYPLKLLPSKAHHLPPPPKLSAAAATPRPDSCLLLFLLSYGGGLLPHDALSLELTLKPVTRLTITTQGATKVFPSKADPPVSGLQTAKQTILATIQEHAGLFLSPDPTQPFQSSRYSQTQIFEVHPTASLGVLDWVTEGRSARGEHWDATLWEGKNEVWLRSPNQPSDGDLSAESTPQLPDGQPKHKRVLLLRDNVILDGHTPGAIRHMMHGLGVFGTLILLGPILKSVGEFFMAEFALLPRLGARDWGDAPETADKAVAEASTPAAIEESRRQSQWRKTRWKLEQDRGVLWTAARVRGLVLIKFGAREVEGARHWLRSMVREEGSVEAEFGEGAIMCLR